jgi:hypothetical protein
VFEPVAKTSSTSVEEDKEAFDGLDHYFFADVISGIIFLRN